MKMSFKQLMNDAKSNPESVEHLYNLLTSGGSCIHQKVKYLTIADDLPEELASIKSIPYTIYYTKPDKYATQCENLIKQELNQIFLANCYSENVVSAGYLNFLKSPQVKYQQYLDGNASYDDVKKLANSFERSRMFVDLNMKSVKIPLLYNEFLLLFKTKLQIICQETPSKNNDINTAKAFVVKMKKVMKKALQEYCALLTETSGYLVSTNDKFNNVKKRKRKFIGYCESCGDTFITEDEERKYCAYCRDEVTKFNKVRKQLWKPVKH